MDFIPFISFLMGVASIISPCIIPVLPILFSFTLENKRYKDILAFVLGLFLIFTFLIFLTAFFTVVFYNYILYIRIISSIILILIGILFISNKTFNFNFKSNNNVGLFSLGVLTSLSWSPCYGGYLISLISILLTTGNLFFNVMNIIIYCLGFGCTLFILSFLLSKINVDKLISNSRYLKRITGLLVIITGVYMLFITLGF